jgi:hypothetical protein
LKGRGVCVARMSECGDLMMIVSEGPPPPPTSASAATALRWGLGRPRRGMIRQLGKARYRREVGAGRPRIGFAILAADPPRLLLRALGPLFCRDGGEFGEPIKGPRCCEVVADRDAASELEGGGIGVTGGRVVVSDLCWGSGGAGKQRSGPGAGLLQKGARAS